MAKVTNPKTLRRSNKTNILFKLQNEGGMSRLKLSHELNLTGASITQLVQDLIKKGYIIETERIQNNSTGRREVLLRFNSGRFAAVGVNIERDNIHVSVCNYDKVIEERIYETADLISGGDISLLVREIKDLYDFYGDAYKMTGVGIGIAGFTDETNGISVNSHGILPDNYPLSEKIETEIPCFVDILNNVKAQARALISDRDDNFMYVKHSPGIGCAVVVNGKVVDGFNGKAGELGHTVVQTDGKLCDCGKRGCLETAVSEKEIKAGYFEQTGEKKDINTIYAEYGKNPHASAILDDCVNKFSVAVGNAATLTDPKKIMVTGGLFFQDALLDSFFSALKNLGFRDSYEIIRIENDRKIKAFSGARHILLKKLFEV